MISELAEELEQKDEMADSTQETQANTDENQDSESQKDESSEDEEKKEDPSSTEATEDEQSNTEEKSEEANISVSEDEPTGDGERQEGNDGDSGDQNSSSNKPGSQGSQTGSQSSNGSGKPNPFTTSEDPAENAKQGFLAGFRREARKPETQNHSQDSGNPEKDEQDSGSQTESGMTNADSKSQDGSKQAGNPAKQAQSGKAIVESKTLANALEQGDPTAEFRTTDGIKTAAEIAQELAQNEGARFDLESLDGSFTAKVRGNKTIVESPNPEVTSKLAEMNKPDPRKGLATSGGKLGGSGDSLPEFNVSPDIPHDLVGILPQLRELSGEKRIEVMTKWTSIPSRQRVRGGAEYRLLKGMAHLSALKAISQFEDVEDGEQTMSKAGERVDILQGPILEAPLDELRTIEAAMENGGAIDDDAEIREKRVTQDAPHLMYLVDTSGSMDYENRLQSAIAAAIGTATYYGPKGATFGLTAFADHPARVVEPPESDIDVVIDGLMMLEAGNGTSYARGLELAIRQALPNTTITVYGDFLDSGFPAPEVYAIAKDKNVKVVGIVSVAGNPEYAAEICDETYTVASWDDPSAVALVALKAAS